MRKWGVDGELSVLDLQQILARLGSVDAQAAELITAPQGSTAMQSISTRAPFGRAATSTQARAGATAVPNVAA